MWLGWGFRIGKGKWPKVYLECMGSGRMWVVKETLMCQDGENLAQPEGICTRTNELEDLSNWRER